MRTLAFVGKSGSGKSHRAIWVAKKVGAEAIIDDGLLIMGDKLLAGKSAKKEPTKIASVRRALFFDDEHTKVVRNAIKYNNINCIMLIGTSDSMVEQIARKLDILPIEQIYYIEEFATNAEIEKAQSIRNTQGKHVIPVPTFEIKKDFSGYFMHTLKLFVQGKKPEETLEMQKTIIRPTYSYLGSYSISNHVIECIAENEVSRLDGIIKVNKVGVLSGANGVDISIEVTIRYGTQIPLLLKHAQVIAKDVIETYTSIIVNNVNIVAKNIIL